MTSIRQRSTVRTDAEITQEFNRRHGTNFGLKHIRNLRGAAERKLRQRLRNDPEVLAILMRRER